MRDKIKTRDVITTLLVVATCAHYMFTGSLASLVVACMWYVILKLDFLLDDIKELRGTNNESKKSN